MVPLQPGTEGFGPEQLAGKLPAKKNSDTVEKDPAKSCQGVGPERHLEHGRRISVLSQHRSPCSRIDRLAPSLFSMERFCNPPTIGTYPLTERVTHRMTAHVTGVWITAWFEGFRVVTLLLPKQKEWSPRYWMTGAPIISLCRFVVHLIVKQV